MAELHDRYIPEEWEDYPSEETPIDAESLNHIEQGISNNSEDIEAINEEIEAINEDITNTTRYRVVSEFTGEVPQRDADLLGGHVPSYYATKQQLDDEVAEINDRLDNILTQYNGVDSVTIPAGKYFVFADAINLDYEELYGMIIKDNVLITRTNAKGVEGYGFRTGINLSAYICCDSPKTIYFETVSIGQIQDKRILAIKID